MAEVTQMQKMMMETSEKKIRVTCKDGKVFEGVNKYFTQPLDNEPEVASICIKEEGYSYLTELIEPEIEKIEEIK